MAAMRGISYFGGERVLKTIRWKSAASKAGEKLIMVLSGAGKSPRSLAGVGVGVGGSNPIRETWPSGPAYGAYKEPGLKPDSRSGVCPPAKAGGFYQFGDNRAKLFLKYVVVLAVAAISSSTAAAQQPKLITLDQAIQMAVDNSPSIRALRTTIDQNKALEVTANLRPNPMLLWDAQFFPFDPSLWSAATIDQTQQFDMGLAYTFERGKKRQARFEAAHDQTNVTIAQVHDAERALSFNVATQFVGALLAEEDLKFSQDALQSFQKSVDINEDRYKAGAISKDDLLKIKLQLLQFQSDVNAAKLARVQALVTMRQLIGYSQIVQDYDVDGQLVYEPVKGRVEDFQIQAIKQRPDLQAAQLGVTAAQSQLKLAKADGKQDLTVTLDYSHVSGYSGFTTFFSIPLAVFNRNQGEIARTTHALNQARLNSTAAQDTVMSDVSGAYETVKANDEIVQLYQTGYLQQSQESRDINEFAYKQGAEALIDFLDAERSYRATQLAYRQSLANYQLAVEQLREAIGTRKLP